MLEPELWPFHNPCGFPSITYNNNIISSCKQTQPLLVCSQSQQRLFLHWTRTECINTVMRRRGPCTRGSSASPAIIGCALLKLLRWNIILLEKAPTTFVESLNKVCKQYTFNNVKQNNWHRENTAINWPSNKWMSWNLIMSKLMFCMSIIVGLVQYPNHTFSQNHNSLKVRCLRFWF